MADPADQHVARPQVRVVYAGMRLGDDQLVDVGPEGQEARAAVGCRLREFGDEVTVDPHLPGEFQRHDVRRQGATVRRAQGHEGVHTLIAPEALDKVAPDESTE